VKKSKVITGEKIRPGDVVIGLPSGGLQTNGYSLARKVIFDKCGHGLQDIFPGTKSTVTQILLAVHKSFLKPVTALMDAKIPIPGMAHITGGGFYDNIPRVLPDNCDAEIDRSSWSVPPVFTFIEREGKVDHDEMYRVFNMGIGYTIIVRPKDVDATMKILKKMRQAPLVIGKITKGKKVVTCIN
jgi:phosphoribosylformylglycinamidine cyclo-ligase